MSYFRRLTTESYIMYKDDADDRDVKMSLKDALIFKSHDAVDLLKKVLKDCYVQSDDDDDESCFQYALEQLSDVKNALPDLPKKKETTEERRRRKENEF
jgi:hypothetical protein